VPSPTTPPGGSAARSGSDIAAPLLGSGGFVGRRLVCSLGLVLVAAPAVPTAARAQAAELPDRDRRRLAEALRIADQVRDRVWPGWQRTPLAVLLVADSAEFLIRHPRPSDGFVRLRHDPLLKSDVWTRPRRFPPTMLATFPAVGGLPTIVVGTAERTGKSSTGWVLTLMHEHFHQWQYSRPDYYEGVAGLDLAGVDTTGQWMLDYRFPYDSAPVQLAVRRLADALGQALDAPPSARAEALSAAVEAREALRRSLAAADYRYMEFQLWQEGVARFIEYAAAGAAAAVVEPDPAFRSLSDYEAYDAAAARAIRDIRQELEQLSLERERRVAFYPLGAAIALLLDQTRPDWKRIYFERPYALAALLPCLPPR